MGILSSIRSAARTSPLLHTYFGIVRRIRPLHLLGPLFVYDLVRLARRGRTIQLRFLYAIFLLGALILAYVEGVPTQIRWKSPLSIQTRVTDSQLAEFTHTFIWSVLVLQAGMVLAITPVYLADAIAEEKERQTLWLLFASHLNDGEIVLGRLFARLTHLGFVFLTGMPALVLTAFLARPSDRALLLASILSTGMTLLSLGSVCMLLSVLSRNSLMALLKSYGFLLVFNLYALAPPLLPYTSPLGFVFALDNRLREAVRGSPAAPVLPKALSMPAAIELALPMTLGYLLLHGLITLLCCRLAVGHLRTSEPDPLFRTPPATQPRLVPISSAFDEAKEPLQPPVRQVPRKSLLPPMEGDPLLWKEMAHDPPAWLTPVRKAIAGIALIVLVNVGIFWLLAWICQLFSPTSLEELTMGVNGVLRVLTISVACIYSLGVGFRTASSLSRERDRRTLEMLLMVPMSRAAIFRAKCLSGILRYRMLGFVFIGLLLLGLLTGALHPRGMLLLAGHVAAVIFLLASSGVLGSILARNTMWAQLSMALLLLVLFGSPVIRMNQTYEDAFSEDPHDTVAHLWQVGLNPVVGWWLAGFSCYEGQETLAEPDGLSQARLKSIQHGIAVLSALAAVCWLAARLRLNKEPITRSP
ncbi:MAG TPA: ABC transporter permease subunit [Gemmataceae bacterium]|nr:ABC transporter permease subunit [Gemmataceae bacterium]